MSNEFLKVETNIQTQTDVIINDYIVFLFISTLREPAIICSYIWHIDIPKCVHWLNTQSVKAWWRYGTLDMNIRQ